MEWSELHPEVRQLVQQIENLMPQPDGELWYSRMVVAVSSEQRKEIVTTEMQRYDPTVSLGIFRTSLVGHIGEDRSCTIYRLLGQLECEL